MEYWKIKIHTTTAGIDMLTGVLMDLGFDSFVVEDGADFEEFLAKTQPYWDYVDDSLMALRDREPSIAVYAAKNAQGADRTAQIRSALADLKRRDTDGLWGRLEIEIEDARDEDWDSVWKQFYKPFPVGDRLFIRPSWEHGAAPDGRLTLLIDPESSFGTGTHETTQLCLAALEKAVRPGCEVLDMGCGSGILSCAALLLGAGHAEAVDVDENAVRIARRNLERNIHDPARCEVRCGNALSDPALADSLSSKRRDVVVANIVADVIIAMRPLFSACLAPGGTLIVSGIIGKRADEVRRALGESGFAVLASDRKNDWLCYRLQKKERE